MRGLIVPGAILLWMVSPAIRAQTAQGGQTGQLSAPLESVTVTATKASRTAIENFIFARAAPTRVTDKLARWRVGICPLTVGLGPKFVAYVSQRVRDIADSVGAPVNKDAVCKPNIRIVFTTAPQGLLDNVLKTMPAYLGYFDTRAQAARLATVTHPIQSWYTTATGDLDGNAQVDSANPTGITITMPAPPPIPGGPASFVQGTHSNEYSLCHSQARDGAAARGWAHERIRKRLHCRGTCEVGRFPDWGTG